MHRAGGPRRARPSDGSRPSELKAQTSGPLPAWGTPHSAVWRGPARPRRDRPGPATTRGGAGPSLVGLRRERCGPGLLGGQTRFSPFPATFCEALLPVGRAGAPHRAGCSRGGKGQAGACADASRCCLGAGRLAVQARHLPAGRGEPVSPACLATEPGSPKGRGRGAGPQGKLGPGHLFNAPVCRAARKPSCLGSLRFRTAARSPCGVGGGKRADPMPTGGVRLSQPAGCPGPGLGPRMPLAELPETGLPSLTFTPSEVKHLQKTLRVTQMEFKCPLPF